MRVLVTGAGGFLGRRVLEMLMERGGFEVRALVRRNAPEIAALGAEVYTADLRDMAALRPALESREAVIHCAARPGVWGPLDAFIQANVLTTANILMAAREAGVRCFVHTSSPSVVHTGRPLEGADEKAPLTANPLHAYPYSKMLAERLVLAANGPGFNTVALRPHLIWGPGDPHFMPRLLNRARRNALWLLKSEALVDATYIDNAALAHILALEKLAKGAPIGGRAYFIAQGEPRAAAELIGKILEAASGGRAAVRGTLPAWLGKAGGFILERMWNLLKLAGEPPLTSFVAEELTLPHWFNLEAARRDLGYDPPVSTALGLAKLAEYHRGQGADPDFRSLSSSHAEKR